MGSPLNTSAVSTRKNDPTASISTAGSTAATSPRHHIPIYRFTCSVPSSLRSFILPALPRRVVARLFARTLFASGRLRDGRGQVRRQHGRLLGNVLLALVHDAEKERGE